MSAAEQPELVTRKPLQRHEFDLVVVGGGLAGLCAALAAARGGARTAIVQDRPVFGGNSSSEVRVVPYGASHGAAWGSETGIVHKLVLADRATNHESFFDHGLMNSHYDMTLAEAVRQQDGLTAFMNTSVRGVLGENAVPGSGYERRVVAVDGSQLGSEKELLLHAKQFIDATGDGTLGMLAGADWRYGRDARSDFGEPLAPRTADLGTLGSTITMRARKIDRAAPYVAPDWVASYTSPADFIMDRRLYHIEKETFGGYWWLEVNTPFHQIDDNQAIRDELHRHVLGVWNYLKNHSPEKAKFTNYVLDWIGQIPGKRESRRLVGDVVVTEHHCHSDNHWPDGIGYASWWIDLHISGGINNREAPGERENIDERYSDYVRVVPFSLPLRAFYSRNVENLWMAGRILSVSHVALGPVRVQLSLGAHAQSVGAAAAYAIKRGLTPRQTADPHGAHIGLLRQLLLRQDVRLLDARNCDPTDLALTAQATASSAVPLSFLDPDTEGDAAVRWLPLDRDRAQVLPLTTERVTSAAFYVRGADVDTVVQVDLEQIVRIWDRENGTQVASSELNVPAGHVGWVTTTFDTAVEAGRPHRFILRHADGVDWAAMSPSPIGTVAQYLTRSPGGCEPKNAELACFAEDEVELPAFELWRQWRKGSLLVRLDPVQRPYDAPSAINGAAWPEELPNLWLSEPVTADQPQWLQLAWNQNVTIASLHVSFDTELDARTDQRPAFHRSRQCAESWRVVVRTGGTWRVVHSESGNVQRHRVVDFADPLTADAVRIEILAVHGKHAGVGIYEVRVHAK